MKSLLGHRLTSNLVSRSQKPQVHASSGMKAMTYLTSAAVNAVQDIGAGHVFAIFLRDAFPINVLNSVKMCPEVCRIYCATANPLEVIVAETEQGRGILGVVDGYSPKGIEKDADKNARKTLLRNFGYKVK